MAIWAAACEAHTTIKGYVHGAAISALTPACTGDHPGGAATLHSMRNLKRSLRNGLAVFDSVTETTSGVLLQQSAETKARPDEDEADLRPEVVDRNRLLDARYAKFGPLSAIAIPISLLRHPLH
jgi:hypothetical protein